MSQVKAIALGIVVTIAVVIAGLFLIGKIVNVVSTDAENLEKQEQVAPVYSPATADDLFTLVNHERGKAGLQPLIRMNELDVSAQFKADDMAYRNYFTHEDPITGKKNGVDKIFELTGATCFYGGENFQYGGDSKSTKEVVVSDWMASQSHREAILDPTYTYTGIGIATTKEGTHIHVQHFCKAN